MCINSSPLFICSIPCTICYLKNMNLWVSPCVLRYVSVFLCVCVIMCVCVCLCVCVRGCVCVCVFESVCDCVEVSVKCRFWKHMIICQYVWVCASVFLLIGYELILIMILSFHVNYYTKIIILDGIICCTLGMLFY